MAVAYCYASGEIEIGDVAPEGTLPITTGEADALRELMSTVARHAHDGQTLLVPGVPEAATQGEALDALLAWRAWLQQRQATEPTS